MNGEWSNRFGERGGREGDVSSPSRVRRVGRDSWADLLAFALVFGLLARWFGKMNVYYAIGGALGFVLLGGLFFLLVRVIRLASGDRRGL